MTSSEMKKHLQAIHAEIDRDHDSHYVDTTGDYILPVFDAILFQCLGMKEEIESIRTMTFFSSFSIIEIKAVKQKDYYVGFSMDHIWMEQNSWCCALDFEDDVSDWLYASSIYEALIDVIEHAEKKYGEFTIAD